MKDPVHVAVGAEKYTKYTLYPYSEIYTILGPVKVLPVPSPPLEEVAFLIKG